MSGACTQARNTESPSKSSLYLYAQVGLIGPVAQLVTYNNYTVDPMLSASGNLIECHEEVLYLLPLILPKRFDIFSPITGGCSEGLGVL